MNTLQKSEKDLSELVGQKATMLIVNTMGFPVARQIKIQRAEIVSAKRYQSDTTKKMCLLLQYVEKGKRKACAYKYTEADLAIVKGWHEIKNPNSFTIFDGTLLDSMLAEVDQKDIAYIQKDLLD